MLFHQVQIKEKGEKRKSTEQVTRLLLTIVVRNKLRKRIEGTHFYFSGLKNQGKEKKEKKEKEVNVVFFQNVFLTHFMLLCLCLHVCIFQL